jgi:hypothetical protein
MKLSKTGWLLITVGVFLIVLIGLGALRSQQIRQQNQLGEELSTVEIKLNGVQLEQLSRRQEELEQQLSQTVSKFDDARGTLSQSIGSLAISYILFDIADANSVEVTAVSSSGLTSSELGGLTCSALPVTTIIRGELTDIVDFVTRLNGELTTGVISSVEITVPEETGELTYAYIELVVYAYQGG